ncbi:MAG: GpE family phage tail protein, partial [Sphingobium limneticum]
NWQFFVAEVAAHGCPARVDDAMADIAIIFHWPPQSMADMDLSDLMQWRSHAAKRSKPSDKNGKR